MSDAKFQFSNVVVVDGDNIGVIIKTWSGKDGYNYDVYRRYFHDIKNYEESDIKHFIYSKELRNDEMDYYS
jgi:hypothetical protein